MKDNLTSGWPPASSPATVFGPGYPNCRNLLVFIFSLRLGWKGCGLRRSTWHRALFLSPAFSSSLYEGDHKPCRRDMRGSTGTVPVVSCGSRRLAVATVRRSVQARLGTELVSLPKQLAVGTVGLERRSSVGLVIPLFTLRGTSCIFSRCRRGRDRCGPLSRRFGEQPSVLRLVPLHD
jgi:hypothetical protein